jgi:hypothetical protein
MGMGKNNENSFPKIFDKKDFTDPMSTFQRGEASCSGEIIDQMIWKKCQSGQVGNSVLCLFNGYILKRQFPNGYNLSFLIDLFG